MTEEPEPTFSTVAISRLFHTVLFSNEDTRISQKTVQLCGEYLRMFTREAILRANEVRVGEAAKRAGELDVKLAEQGEDVDEEREEVPRTVDEDLVQDVLDVRHLKEVAGLLILDF